MTRVDPHPTKPASVADAIRAGYTKDARKAKQFVYRKDAVAAAVAIHWTRGDVCEINVMGFMLWAICDSHMSMLTPNAYDALMDSIRSSFRSDEVDS